MSWLFRDPQSEHWILGVRSRQLAGSQSEEHENKRICRHIDFPLKFKILLFSVLRRKELEKQPILNSYYISLWGGDDLQDISVKWDSVTPGEGLARRLSLKFPALNVSLSLKQSQPQVCLPGRSLIQPSHHRRKRQFIFILCKSEV